MHPKLWRLLRLGCLLCFGLLATPAWSYDLVLRHGQIVDGTGNASYHADLALTNGRIAAVGKVPPDSGPEIDASGLIVAPGFIDVHTHAEEILDLPLAENFVRMGVTTIILGNCGSSVGDVGRLFRQIERTNVAVNVATLVGHGTVRGKVMGGSFMRPPTPEELEKMKALVAQGMRDGAMGLSTGLIYLPGTFARTDELIALAKVASEFDGIYVSHMRDEGADIMTALEELFRIAREAQLRAQVSHLKLSGKANWGKPHEVLAAIAAARAEGLDITHDQYVYPASSTGISMLVPEDAREGGKFKERMDDSDQKSKIVAEMKDRLAKRGWTDYAYARIADYKPDPSLNGLNIVEAAQKKRGTETLDDQIELILEMQLHGGASAVFHGISEDDLRVFLRHPNTMVASDSGVREFNQGVPHPRGYGNNARLLARYVREGHLLTLEDAIRRMTSLPATTFRLADRGVIRVGHWADLVVFDPKKVEDHATYASPHQYATGFAYVLVNGVPVVDHDEITRKRPGMPVRHTSLLQKPNPSR